MYIKWFEYLLFRLEFIDCFYTFVARDLGTWESSQVLILENERKKTLTFFYFWYSVEFCLLFSFLFTQKALFSFLPGGDIRLKLIEILQYVYRPSKMSATAWSPFWASPRSQA